MGRRILSLFFALGLVVSACTRRDAEIKNVVLVSLDTLGAKHVSAYGYERDTTPNFDRLASEGTLFTHAYTPQVWTMTAHLSMVTGLYPLAHGAAKRRPASPAATSLAQILADAGFATAAFMGTGGWAGNRFGLGRGFETFKTGKVHAEHDNEAVFAWLDEQAEMRRDDAGHRFFLLAHYYDVHSDYRRGVPYWAPDPYKLRYLPDGPQWKRRGGTHLLERLEKEGATKRDREVIASLHDGGVRFTDEVALGALVDKLASLEMLDDTLLIVTSDHGEEIFEHGGVLHKQPYEETSRIPLVLRGPGVPAGHRVDDLVELVDLMPTVLSLLGLPTPEHVQGLDLSPLLTEGGSIPRRQAHVDGLFGAIPPFLMHKQSSVVREVDGVRWSYVNTIHPRDTEAGRVFETRGPGELYRLDRDPEQERNVAADHPDFAGELEAALLDWYAENEAHAVELGPAPTRRKMLSKKQRAQLRALGYAE